MAGPETHPKPESARHRIPTVMIVAIVVIAAIGLLMLGYALERPHPTLSRSQAINVQASDLGSGWVAGTASSNDPNRSLWIEFSSVVFSRTTDQGGKVHIGSAVYVYSNASTATEVFQNATKPAPGVPLWLPENVGDGAAFYAVNAQYPSQFSYIYLVFHSKDVFVTLYVGVNGAWEDLSGRPFTAAYHLVGDVVLLARVMAQRV